MGGQKFYAVIFTFSLGIITMAVSTARFVYLSVTSDLTPIFIWSAAEINAALIVVCLPKVRFLLREYHRKKKKQRPMVAKEENSVVFDGVEEYIPHRAAK